MKRAIIMVGNLPTERGIHESYQLLITDRIAHYDGSQLLMSGGSTTYYLTAVYDGSPERPAFYDEVSDAFTTVILKENPPLEVSVFNGYRIHPETGGHEQLPRLEDRLVDQLSNMVRRKLRQSGGGTIDVPSRN